MFAAVGHSRLGAVKKLLWLGADIDIVDDDGDDALDKAMKKGDEKVFKYIKAVMLNHDIPFDLEYADDNQDSDEDVKTKMLKMAMMLKAMGLNIE